jgi:purine nucleosidase
VWNGNKVNNFNSVSVSQAYNEEILNGMGKMNIPHPIGCNSILGYAWGYYPTATIPKSPAVEFIIAEAKKASPQNKLGVICIGASTNLAAAIETAPEIAANIHAYLLGCQYDSQKQVWNKNEFNIRNDLNAFDAVLNNLQLELTIMPISTARPYVFSKTETLRKLYAINHPTTKLLADMWVHINAAEERVMWDVALIIAIIKPELATLEDRNGPPENIKTSIHVYTSIDVSGMRQDFWKQIQKRFKNRK